MNALIALTAAEAVGADVTEAGLALAGWTRSGAAARASG